MNCLLRTVAIAIALTLLLTLAVVLTQADGTTAPESRPPAAGQVTDAGPLLFALVIGVLLLAFGVWLERLHRLAA